MVPHLTTFLWFLSQGKLYTIYKQVPSCSVTLTNERVCIARIETSQDGSPICLHYSTNPKECKPTATQQNLFGPNAAAFSSLDDIMKNMPKIMANLSGITRGELIDSPTMKISMREYQDIGIKVGDR
jgi:hypothetical protein